ncbi:hypothetical protein M8J75_002196 [Diaphorina citri]|nr:hypothetical protein M8J75_002196 [Diaphorina citri]
MPERGVKTTIFIESPRTVEIKHSEELFDVILMVSSYLKFVPYARKKRQFLEDCKELFKTMPERGVKTTIFIESSRTVEIKHSEELFDVILMVSSYLKFVPYARKKRQFFEDCKELFKTMPERGVKTTIFIESSRTVEIKHSEELFDVILMVSSYLKFVPYARKKRQFFEDCKELFKTMPERGVKTTIFIESSRTVEIKHSEELFDVILMVSSYLKFVPYARKKRQFFEDCKELFKTMPERGVKTTIFIESSRTVEIKHSEELFDVILMVSSYLKFVPYARKKRQFLEDCKELFKTMPERGVKTTIFIESSRTVEIKHSEELFDVILMVSSYLKFVPYARKKRQFFEDCKELFKTMPERGVKTTIFIESSRTVEIKHSEELFDVILMVSSYLKFVPYARKKRQFFEDCKELFKTMPERGVKTTIFIESSRTVEIKHSEELFDVILMVSSYLKFVPYARKKRQFFEDCKELFKTMPERGVKTTIFIESPRTVEIKHSEELFDVILMVSSYLKFVPYARKKRQFLEDCKELFKTMPERGVKTTIFIESSRTVEIKHSEELFDVILMVSSYLKFVPYARKKRQFFEDCKELFKTMPERGVKTTIFIESSRTVEIKHSEELFDVILMVSSYLKFVPYARKKRQFFEDCKELFKTMPERGVKTTIFIESSRTVEIKHSEELFDVILMVSSYLKFVPYARKKRQFFEDCKELFKTMPERGVKTTIFIESSRTVEIKHSEELFDVILMVSSYLKFVPYARKKRQFLEDCKELFKTMPERVVKTTIFIESSRTVEIKHSEELFDVILMVSSYLKFVPYARKKRQFFEDCKELFKTMPERGGQNHNFHRIAQNR